MYSIVIIIPLKNGRWARAARAGQCRRRRWRSGYRVRQRGRGGRCAMGSCEWGGVGVKGAVGPCGLGGVGAEGGGPALEAIVQVAGYKIVRGEGSGCGCSGREKKKRFN
ncbi:hypothetical protein ACOSP7_022036 [Xanthoceras sorbifolium]